MVDERGYFLTGCAHGIGRHLAGELAGRGARLFATDIDIDGLEAWAVRQGWPGHRVHLRKLDVREPVEWQAVFAEAIETLGGVDVAMNVAGYIGPGFVADSGIDEVDRHVDVNVKGVMYGTMTAARHMAARGSGHIINIASLAGIAPVPGLSLYSGTKFAVRAFSVAVGFELADQGVAVTAVCPDAVDTDMLIKQKDNLAAALTFSGTRILSVVDVGDLILGPVLRKRPLVAVIPRHRGWLARTADLWPASGRWLGKMLRRRGEARQHLYARQHPDESG